MPRTSEPIREIESTRDGKTIKRYEARAEAPRESGKPRRQIRRRFDRRRDAIEWLAAMRSGTAEELRPPEPNREVTFSDFAESWLEVKRRTVRPVTGYNYGGAVRVWVAHFGDRPIAEITRSDVEQLISKYQDEGKSVARTGYLLMVLRQILDEATEEEVVGRNVAARVKARGRQPKRRETLNSAEVRQLRDEIGRDRLEALWLLSLAGLRRSEVLGLRWSDLDPETGVLTISRGRVQTGGSKEVTVSSTKTRRGRREITLPDPILDALRRWRSVHAEEFGLAQARDGYLGVDEVGIEIRPEWYSDEWRRLCDRAGVPIVTLHAARHTSVTIMRDLGIPDHLVAEWHGHDEVVMRQTYSHASESGLREAGDRLFDAIGGG